PGMLVGGVVDDQVEDDPDAPFLRFTGQLGKVTKAAQRRVDAVEIAYVVATVTTGTRIDRVEPQAGNAQPVKVIKAADQAPQVAPAVTVGVLGRRNIEAVDGRLLIPPADHGRHLRITHAHGLTRKKSGRHRSPLRTTCSDRTSAPDDAQTMQMMRSRPGHAGPRTRLGGARSDLTSSHASCRPSTSQ